MAAAVAMSVSIRQLGYGLGGPGFDFLLFLNDQTGHGAHLPSNSMDTGVISQGQSGQGVKVTTHLHLLPKLRKSGATSLLPSMPSWRKQGTFNVNT